MRGASRPRAAALHGAPPLRRASIAASRAPRRRSRPICSGAGDGSSAAAALLTCRRCRRQYDPAANGPRECVYHPALWTGGELGKYTGFVPDSPRYEDRMKKRGMVRFWDCCGALEEGAPGCCAAPHASYDDERTD